MPTRVLHTHSAAGVVERRRECPECGRRFGTVERPADADLVRSLRARRALRQAGEIIAEAMETD